MVTQNEKAINHANWVKSKKVTEWLKQLIPTRYDKTYQNTLASLIEKDNGVERSGLNFSHIVINFSEKKSETYILHFVLMFNHRRERLFFSLFGEGIEIPGGVIIYSLQYEPCMPIPFE